MRYNLGDLVAAGMSETLESEEFKKIFAKPAPARVKKASVNKRSVPVDPGQHAFNVFAGEEDEEDEKDEDKDDEKKDKDDKKDKKDKKKGKMPPWLKKDKNDVNFAKDDDDEEEEEEEDEDEEEDEKEDKGDVSFADDKDDDDKDDKDDKKKKDKKDKDDDKEDEDEDSNDDQTPIDNKIPLPPDMARVHNRPGDPHAYSKPQGAPRPAPGTFDIDMNKAAAKKAKCNCPKGCDCKKKGGKCSKPKDCPKHSEMYANAIRYIVDTLNKTSAALDEMGLEKGSMAALHTLDTIVREATANFLKRAEGFDDEDEDEDLKDLIVDEPDELSFSDQEEAEYEDAARHFHSMRPEERGHSGPKPGIVREIEEDETGLPEESQYEMEPEEELNFSDDQPDKMVVRPGGSKPTQMADDSCADDHISPSQLTSSIDPKLEPGGEGHVKHDCGDMSYAQDHMVEAFKALDSWIKKDAEDLDTL